MTLIKICGLTDTNTALATCQAGADYIGLVFAPSKRQVSLETARKISEAVHGLKSPPAVAGVFANAPLEEVNRIASICVLDKVQLSGDEDWQYCQKIEKPFIKVFHISSGKTAAEVIRDIETGYRIITRDFLCLLDTADGNKYGGTGQAFNWELAKEVGTSQPIMVAGGLTPENVGQLVREVSPLGVDVSSGVETDNRKDITMIKAFIEAARQARQEHKEKDNVTRQ